MPIWMCLCLGVDRTQTGYYYAGANAMILQETITRAQEEAAEIEAYGKDDPLGAATIRWGLDSGVSQLADMGRHVAQRARFSDLVILPQALRRQAGRRAGADSRSRDVRGPDTRAHGARRRTDRDRRRNGIMIAWNESDEALAAVRTALPFLQQADSVRIVVIDPPAHGPTRSDPGGLLSQYLARHGVRVRGRRAVQDHARVSRTC